MTRAQWEEISTYCIMTCCTLSACYVFKPVVRDRAAVKNNNTTHSGDSFISPHFTPIVLPPLPPAYPLLLEDRVWCASQITLKLQSCSTGPSASSSCTFIGQDCAGCARPAMLPAYWYTFVWEEMTSQHQTRWKQMRTKHFRCVLTWLGRSSACIPKSPWSEKNNNQAIKQA